MSIKNVLIAFLLIVNVLIPGRLQSQEKGVPVVIKGLVTDLSTGKFGALTMMFEDSEGNKFKIYPDVTNGKYQQVLNSGVSYKVSFLHYDVFRESFSLEIPFSDKYLEIEKNFQIRRLIPNLTLYDTNIFLKGSAELTPEGAELVANIIRAASYSRGAEFQFIISSGKAATLLQQRMATITSLAGFARVKSRIKISEGNDANDFKAIVTSIKDPLN